MVSFCWCVPWCCRSRQEEDQNTAALEQLAMLMEQVRRLAAAMPPLPVVKKELGYFPYSGAVETSAERQQLECPICLEALVHGEACGEIPACRHLFHQECIDPWMDSNSTCPVCRCSIMPGSEPLSAAEDMV